MNKHKEAFLLRSYKSRFPGHSMTKAIKELGFEMSTSKAQRILANEATRDIWWCPERCRFFHPETGEEV